MIAQLKRVLRLGIIVIVALSAALISAPQRIPLTAAPAQAATGSPCASTIGLDSWEPFTDVNLMSGMGLHVDDSNGNLVLQIAGPDIPGVNGLDEALAFTYNLASSAETDLGTGWIMTPGPDMDVEGNVTFCDPTGKAYMFTPPTDPPGSGSVYYTSPPGIDATLIEPDNGGSCAFLLTFNASQAQYCYDLSKRLLSITNRQGNSISFSYSGSTTQVTAITNTEGQTTSLTYSNGLITQIKDPAGNAWSFAYSGSNLASIERPDTKTILFQTNGSGQLSQITDPKGNITQVSYDTSNRVSSIVRENATAPVNPAWSWLYNPSQMTTVVTDPNTHTTTYQYDSSGRVTAVKDAQGHTTSTTWTADNHVATVQEPSGATTTNTYDSVNNLTQVSYPSGASASWAYANGSLPYNPSSSTDAQGNTTTYQYNSQGLPTSATNALSHTTSTTYNSNGTVASVTDANGHTTSYQYNSQGLQTGVIYAANQTGSLTLAGSDGVTWRDMDAADLSLSITPTTSCTSVVSGNASLWTNAIGANPDIAIWIAGGSYGTGQVMAWKESGGTAAFGPDAAYIQATAALVANTTYTVKLQWKANASTSSTIVAGAGTSPNFSPTTLTALCSSTTSVSTAFQTKQYDLTGSDGKTWVDMDSTGLALSITPSSSCSAILSGNADLWTNTIGYNQDLEPVMHFGGRDA